jgi:hypothetical protein
MIRRGLMTSRLPFRKRDGLFRRPPRDLGKPTVERWTARTREAAARPPQGAAHRRHQYYPTGSTILLKTAFDTSANEV